MQPSIFDLRPDEIEQPYELGDYVTGTDPNGNPSAGYICAFGIKWLILSAIPRCGTYSSGHESGDFYKLSSTAALWATAKRTTPPDQTTQQELF